MTFCSYRPFLQGKESEKHDHKETAHPDFTAGVVADSGGGYPAVPMPQAVCTASKSRRVQAIHPARSASTCGSTSVVRDVTFTPLDGYRLAVVTAYYDGKTVNTTVQDKPAQLIVGGMVLPLRHSGREITVTVPGNCTGDLVLSASVEAVLLPHGCKRRQRHRGQRRGTYGIDKTVTITAAPSGEAEITRVQVTRTDAGQANTADLADGAVQIGDKTYPFSVTDGKVTMTLTAEESLGIHFFSNGKPGEQPLTVRVRGDKGVDVDRSRVKVRRGNDANIIADAGRGYEITEIRLDDGVQSAAGYVSEGRIWLGGKVYRIDRDGGRVTLRLPMCKPIWRRTLSPNWTKTVSLSRYQRGQAWISSRTAAAQCAKERISVLRSHLMITIRCAVLP